MSGTEEHSQTEDLPALSLVSGHLFDGTPCDIALEATAVGSGSSARIRKGYLLGDNPRVVAVKVFGELLDDAKQQLLVRELHFAREVSMRHPSIVGFLGTATVGEQTAIVSFYMENGSLMQYIKSHAECDKRKLILQVAEAVEFLHVEMRLVHGDLKCDNVLVSDFGNALLADFGLSSFVEKSERLSTTLTAIRLMNTLQFAAPELLGVLGDDETPVSKKTTASDIYAFGMLVLEAISEQPPWGKKKNVAVITSVSARKHPPRPTLGGTFVATSHSWWDVCRRCWSFVPHERPQISDVLRTLKVTNFAPYEIRTLPSMNI